MMVPMPQNMASATVLLLALMSAMAAASDFAMEEDEVREGGRGCDKMRKSR